MQVSGNPAASVLPAAAGSTSCAVAEYLPAPDWTIKYKAAVIELRQLVRRYIKASCRAPHDFGPLLCAARLHHGPVVSQATVDDIVYSFYTNYTHWSSEVRHQAHRYFGKPVGSSSAPLYGISDWVHAPEHRGLHVAVSWRA